MAKLTERQKSNIQAKWDTGQYTKTQLAKKYKVSEAAIRKIVGLREPSNAHIVEANVMLEEVKRFEKSSIEVREIEKATEYALSKKYDDDKKVILVDNASTLLLEKITDKLNKNTKKEVVKVNQYAGGKPVGQTLETIDVELESKDYKDLADGIDKASLTIGVNERFSNSQVNVQNNNQVINDITITEV